MAASPTTEPSAQGSSLRVGAWVLYDLANTVYIATVTFVFTPYARAALENDLRGHSIANFLSMVAAAMLVPFFGALIDTTGRARRYLVISTLTCVGALAGWYLDLGSLWLLACFFAANLAYNVALLFYNSLLTSVAPPERAGRVSGLGVGLGYLGTILVLLIAPMGSPDKRPFFLTAALLFLGLALPCLLLVKDRRRVTAPKGPLGTVMRDANRRLLTTLKELPKHRPLMWFLLGNFCLVDELNTAVLYFADFTEEVFAPQAEAGYTLFGAVFQGREGIGEFMQLAGLCLNLIALLVGGSIGRWTDRAPLAVMRSSAVLLLLALLGGAVFGGVSPLGCLCTLVALGAFGLTGIWTAGRKVIVQLAPPDQIGQYFGLYGITVKLSVFGAVVYGYVHHSFGAKPAMLAQSTQLLLGLLCLFMVRLPAARPAANAR